MYFNFFKFYHNNTLQMKKCRNCSRQSRYKKQPQYRISTQYCIGRLASPPKVLVYNNQYMLEIVVKTNKKTKKLDKQVSKIKSQIKNLRKSLEHRVHSKVSIENKQSQVRQVYYGNYEEREGDDKKSRLSSINTSKNREIGRFTRVSEGQSLSTKQIGSDQTIEWKNKIEKQKQTVSLKQIEEKKRNVMFCKPFNNNQRSKLQMPMKEEFAEIINENNENHDTSNYSSDMMQQDMIVNESKSQSSEEQEPLYETTFNKREQSVKNPEKDNKNLLMYLPSYQNVESSQSCLLDPDDDVQILNQKERLQRQFQQLVIIQKSASQSGKKPIREEIKAISNVLSNLQGLR